MINTGEKWLWYGGEEGEDSVHECSRCWWRGQRYDAELSSWQGLARQPRPGELWQLCRPK